MSTELPAGPAHEVLNPFAPPRAAIDEAPVELESADLAEAEAIRRQYIGHEAAVKSIGSLQYLGFFFALIGGIGMVVFAFMAAPQGNLAAQGALAGIGLFYLALSALQFALGWGLRGLQNWARWTTVALISIFLLFSYAVNLITMRVDPAPLVATVIGLAIGSLIPGYILYLLVSSKANTVFSPEYRAIIARTPHIKRGTSLVLKIALVVLVAILALIVVSAIVSR